MSGKAAFVLALAGSVALPAVAGAAVAYSISGSTYSQNFDSLPNTPTNANIQTVYTDGWQDDVDPLLSPQNDVSIPGWYLDHRLDPTGTEDGFNHHQRLRFGSGTQGTGAFWGFGATGSTDRALGDVGSTTTAATDDSLRVGLRLTNTTGQTLTSFTVTYDGEQWRDGASTTPETMNFSYMMDGTTASNWHTAGAGNPATFVPQLAFVAPVNGATSAAVDGNGAGRVADISFTVTDITWEAGTDLWLRWSDPQVGGSAVDDDGLAIDNVRFEAFVPEPGSFAMIGLGALGLLSRRRSR